MPNAGNDSGTSSTKKYTPPRPAPDPVLGYPRVAHPYVPEPKRSYTPPSYNALKPITQDDYKANGSKYTKNPIKSTPTKPKRGYTEAQLKAAKARKAAAARVASKGSNSVGGKASGGGAGAGKGTGKPTTSKTGSKTTSKSTKTDFKSQASQAVSAELDPKLKAIKDQQAAFDKAQKQAQDENKARGAQVSHDIEFLYKQLDQKLAEQQAQSAAAYGSAASQVDSNYAQLLSTLTNNTNQSVDKVNAEAARLGLTPPVESQAGADGNFAGMLAQTNRQNAALMLQAQGQNNASTGQFMRDANQGLGATKTSDFKTANNNALNDLIKNQLAQDTEYGNQLTNLEMQRSTMERQYLQQLEQQAYDRQQEALQQQFMNSMAVNKFNLSADKFNADQAYRQATLDLERLKIINAGQKASSSSNVKLDPGGATDYIKSTISNANTELGLMQAFNFARYSGEFNFNDKKNRNQAIEAMRQWLQTNRPDLIQSNEFLGYLSNAYDIYTGVSYA
jgi:hypothetical protein